MQIKSKKLKINKEIIFLDSSLYPLEAVYTTCYTFLDRFYIFLDKKDNKIEISLEPKERKENLRNIKGEFINELINNSLRYMISKRNQKIREYIVKTALFFSQPQEELDEFLISEELK